MMGKFLACLGLIALSLGVLHLTIGVENFAVSSVVQQDQPLSVDEQPTGGGQLPIKDAAGKSTPVTITTKGKKRIPMRSKKVLLEDGSELLIPLYTLIADDSEPVRDDLWRLEGVRVEFHEQGEDANGRPTAILVGELIASTAFVQIGRDANGMPSIIKEDRDIDLRDVIFHTEPTAKIKNLHLQVSRIMVRSSDVGTKLHTPTPDEPFELVLKDGEELTMTGRGLDFYMPAEGDLETERYMEIHVNSHPRLDREDISLHAEGTLDYRESMARGVARVTLDDAVSVRGFGGATRSKLVADGDHLDAVLVRGGRGMDTGAIWQKLRLIGERVTLSSGDMELVCRQLDVSPSLGGEPYLLTASGLGSPVSLEQAGDQPLSFSAASRIHLIRLDQYFDPIQRGFGISGGMHGSWMQQLIVFEGKSAVRDRSRGLNLTAADGIRLLRSVDGVGPSMVVGLGTVDVAQTGLTMQGDAGFTLWQDLEKRRLRLGPAEPDREHFFSLASEEGPSFSGHGLCELTKRTDGTVDLHLISPNDDLEIVQADAQLSAIGELTARLVDGEPTEMLAIGEDCHLARNSVNSDERIDGHAARIETVDGRNFKLRGAPAKLRRGADGSDLQAPQIEIFQLDGDQVMVIAKSEGPHMATATLTRAAGVGQPATRTQLAASRIRLLPHLQEADLLELESLGLDAYRSVREEQHLFARGRVLVTQEGEDGTKLADAHGEAFIMRLSEQSGLLYGTPATIDRSQADGRKMTAMARLVHFDVGEDGETVMVLAPTPREPPVVEIRGFKGNEFGDFENLRITCQGEIHARQDKVEFLGPVRVQQLDAEGHLLPGMSLVAEHMDMLSEGDQLSQIIASGDAVLEFEAMTIKGDQLKIDVLESSCLAIGEKNDVEISYPGSFARGPMMKINYRTRDMESWFINLDTDGNLRGR